MPTQRSYITDFCARSCWHCKHIDHESVYRFTGSFRGLRWDVNVQGQRDIMADQGR